MGKSKYYTMKIYTANNTNITYAVRDRQNNNPITKNLQKSATEYKPIIKIDRQLHGISA
jgi:hypothetical protein